MIKQSITALALLTLVAGCATTDGAASGGLGSMAEPVRADMPPGQRAYLDRLRCRDGSAPAYSRLGSMGLGQDHHVIDGYEVRCAGQAAAMVHMDMYHPGYVENRVPAPFTLAASPHE